MRRLFALALILLCGVAAHPEPLPPARIEWYRGSFEDALELARQRNLPLMFVFLTDGEESSEILAEDVFKDAKVVSDSRQTVPVLCCTGEHGTRRERRRGKRISTCKKYGSVTCTQHQSFHGKGYALLFSGGVMRTPTIRLCHPGNPDDDELKMLAESVDAPTASAMRLAIRSAVKKMGPGVDAKTFDVVREALTRAGNERRKGRPALAWGYLDKAPKVAPDSFLGKKMAREREEISFLVKGELAKAANQGLVDYAVALTEVKKVFAGSSLAKEAKTSLEKLGKTKDGKAALKAARRDAKFRKELDRAAAHFEKKRWERSIRSYLRVVERAKGLPSARLAQERLEKMKEDPRLARRIADILAADAEEKKAGS